MGYFSDAVKTYLENWPDALARLSFATAFIELDKAECESLRACYYWAQGDREFEPNADVLKGLRLRIDDAIQQFPSGAFVKLGSRSPKDAWDGHAKRFRCESGAEVLSWFASSERIADDLSLAIANDYSAHIAVREWRDIPPGEEFRAFVSEKRIAGLSQYDYRHQYPEMVAQEGAVRFAVTQAWPEIAAALHVDPVIADLWVHPQRQQNNVTVWQVKLIEINPWGFWTDPCLFSWKDVAEWSQADPYELRWKRS